VTTLQAGEPTHSGAFRYQCKSSVHQNTMIRPKAHSPSYAVSFRGSFSGGKRLWFDPIHSHSFVDVRIEWSHASNPHYFLFCTEGKHYICTILGYFTLFYSAVCERVVFCDEIESCIVGSPPPLFFFCDFCYQCGCAMKHKLFRHISLLRLSVIVRE
jgi:hypothetical protein